MTFLLSLLGDWLLFAVWQSTLFLGAALLLGRICRKTPSKAHVFYTIGILAAIVCPCLSTAIARHDAGLLPFRRGAAVFETFPVRIETFGLLLAAGAIGFAILLLYGIFASRRLMFFAKPFPDRESQEALLQNAAVLQNVSLPILFTSPNVKTPTVWCWGLHPAVLLPESLAERISTEERDAIFLHELAHITRRDHLTGLLIRLCGALLFWNPLYWFVLRNSETVADESCDLLVIARGNVSPENYIETLMRVAAGEKRTLLDRWPVLQFLSRKEKIMKRINRIIDFGEQMIPRPTAISRVWGASAIAATLLLSLGIAFCQEKKTAPARSSFETDGDPLQENKPIEPGKYTGEEAKQVGGRIMQKFREINAYWLWRPSPEITELSYTFEVKPKSKKDGAPIVEKIALKDDLQTVPFAQVRGISYIGVTDGIWQFSWGNGLIYKSVEVSEKEIKIHFQIVENGGAYQYLTNGLDRGSYGSFDQMVPEGMLYIDAKTYTPIGVRLPKNAYEKYSDFVKLDETHFVPRRIEVANAYDLLFEMQFKVYAPGLWLLEQSVCEFKGKEFSKATVRDVVVNGTAAATEEKK